MLDSITLLQRTNVTRYRKCHLKKAARNQRFHPKDMSCNTPVYHGMEAATFHFKQTRNKKRACHGDMGLAKRTSLKKIFMTACVRRLLRGHPPPLNIFLLQIYTNHTNYLFWIKNGEFRRQVTSLHACIKCLIEIV